MFFLIKPHIARENTILEKILSNKSFGIVLEICRKKIRKLNKLIIFMKTINLLKFRNQKDYDILKKFDRNRPVF